tara:strand:- start:1772 stop:1996 length:225 start_codon:yes stop_codon:yes gene_type:complete
LENFLKPISSSFQLIEEKINLLILLFEGIIALIFILILIWLYGFIRKNLGLDTQTKELKKIRKLLEKNDIKDQK